MATFSRRKLLQLSTSTVISSISIPTSKQVSATERLHLQSALGESIRASWKLLQTARTDQLLTVGHAQLYLVQQSSAILPYNARPQLFSSVYRLIGAALHFQGRYDEAYQALEKAQLSALDGIDTWNMVQSRMWQIDVLKAQGMYPEAIEMMDAALRLISTKNDQESIRTKAHLLAIGAECAALIGDERGVQSRLEDSEKLLENFSELHEEFDRAFWHQIAGVCTLHLNQNEVAIRHFQQAKEALPTQWVLRHALILMPLVIAYARLGDRDTVLTTAEQAISLISAFNAPSLNKQFTEYTSSALTEAFAGDTHVNTFLADIPYKLISIPAMKTS